MNGNVAPVDVRIVRSPEDLTELAVEFGAWSTFTVPQIGTNTGTLAPILSRRVSRDEARILIPAAPLTSNNSPAVVTPAVPATGVAAQNPNPYGVQVVISANGATITNVSVNGVTVGTAAGTYFVPQFGAISIAYSVATPTWVWSQFPVPANNVSALTAVVLAHRADYVANPSNPQGAVIPVSMLPVQIIYKAQQPLYAVGVGASATVLTLDQAQAASQAMTEESIEEIDEEYQESGQGGTGPSWS